MFTLLPFAVVLSRRDGRKKAPFVPRALRAVFSKATPVRTLAGNYVNNAISFTSVGNYI